MLYTFICETCERVVDDIQHPNDYHVLTCECGEKMHQDYSGKRITLSGELPATKGAFHEFYDGVSGKKITSQRMWDDVKKATGRIQYDPDPEHSAAWQDAKHFQKYAEPGTTEHRQAVIEGERKMKAVHARKTEARLDKKIEKQKQKLLEATAGIELAQE